MYMLPVKAVPEMIYTVSGEMLNLTHSDSFFMLFIYFVVVLYVLKSTNVYFCHLLLGYSFCRLMALIVGLVLIKIFFNRLITKN